MDFYYRCLVTTCRVSTMEIKVLGVSATPRRYGYSELALRLALKVAELEGAKVRMVNLYDYDIKPCLGCVSDDVKLCKWPCVIEDDMRILYEYVRESDVLIISSPIYWYNVPGVLKNFIDRLTLFENMIFIEGRSWLEGKVVGFIAVGNDVGAIALIQNLMITLNSMGAAIPPWALAYHAEKERNAFENESFLLDVANVARCCVLMAKALKYGERPSYWYRADEEFKSLVRKFADEILKEVENRIERGEPL